MSQDLPTNCGEGAFPRDFTGRILYTLCWSVIRELTDRSSNTTGAAFRTAILDGTLARDNGHRFFSKQTLTGRPICLPKVLDSWRRVALRRHDPDRTPVPWEGHSTSSVQCAARTASPYISVLDASPSDSPVGEHSCGDSLSSDIACKRRTFLCLSDDALVFGSMLITRMNFNGH